MKKSHLLLLLLLMAGCTFFRSPGRDECDKILSREKMTDLLTDIYLLEGYLLELQSINPAMQDSVADYFAGLFDRHGVTYQEFDQALSCYLLHEREMQQIHEEVLQRYSIMESQVEPFMPEDQSPGGQAMDGQVPEGMDGQAPEGLQDSIPDHRLR
jgi:hypothetical protein